MPEHLEAIFGLERTTYTNVTEDVKILHVTDLENNAMDPAEVPEVPLLQVWVALVLENGWLVLEARDVQDLSHLQVQNHGLKTSLNYLIIKSKQVNFIF